jgi:hypothetical protein
MIELMKAACQLEDMLAQGGYYVNAHRILEGLKEKFPDRAHISHQEQIEFMVKIMDEIDHNEGDA